MKQNQNLKTAQTQKGIQTQHVSQDTIQLMKLIESNVDTIEKEILNEVTNNPYLEFEEEHFSNNENNKECSENFDMEGTDSNNDSYDEFYENNYTEEQEYKRDYEDDDYTGKELDYLISTINQSKDDNPFQPSAIYVESVQEQLKSQLHEYNLSDDDFTIAEQLIGSLDSSGYLLLPIADEQSTYSQNPIFTITSNLSAYYNIQTTPEHVENILKKYVQTLEPAGIGARSLQECLILQIKYGNIEIEDKLRKKTLFLLENYFDLLGKRKFEEIIRKMKLKKEDFSNIHNIILHLSPYPLNALIQSKNTQNQITPDFVVTLNGDQIELKLNSPKSQSNLKISSTYKNLSDAKLTKEDLKFITEKKEGAQKFIDMLNLREHKLRDTMIAIINWQKEYFLTGDEKYIKPLILKDIANEVKYDETTISRITNSKYVETPFGTFPLKKLFSPAVGKTENSSKEVQSVLREIIDAEDKNNPLSDEKLAQVLCERGYPIKRRTVAKYRETNRILPASQRRKSNI